LVVKVEVEKRRVVENQNDREVMKKSVECYRSVVHNLMIVHNKMIVLNQRIVLNQNIMLQSSSETFAAAEDSLEDCTELEEPEDSPEGCLEPEDQEDSCRRIHARKRFV
jgi:hypothetical protein